MLESPQTLASHVLDRGDGFRLGDISLQLVSPNLENLRHGGELTGNWSFLQICMA